MESVNQAVPGRVRHVPGVRASGSLGVLRTRLGRTSTNYALDALLAEPRGAELELERESVRREQRDVERHMWKSFIARDRVGRTKNEIDCTRRRAGAPGGHSRSTWHMVGVGGSSLQLL